MSEARAHTCPLDAILSSSSHRFKKCHSTFVCIRIFLYYYCSLQTRAGATAAGEDGARGGAEADPRRHQRHGEHHQAVRGQQEECPGQTNKYTYRSFSKKIQSSETKPNCSR